MIDDRIQAKSTHGQRLIWDKPRGPRWLRSIIQSVLDRINERQPIPGLGILLHQTQHGIEISTTTPFGGRKASGGKTHTPWEISVTGNPVDGYVATVRPGSVNSLVPSNIFSTFPIVLDAVTYWVKIKCDTDGKTPNAITLVVNTTAIDPATLVTENVAPPTFYDVIGVIRSTFSGSTWTGTVFQVRFDNLTATPVIDFVVSQTAASPLDEPFVRWFKWAIT